MFDFASNVLGLAWSLAFSTTMKTEVGYPLRKHIVLLGEKMDVLAMQQADFSTEDDLEEGVDVRLPGVPYALVNLPGIMVVFKPENWEVNRGDPDQYRGDVEWHLLSDWVTAALPRTQFPLVHSKQFDFGFIHRLDVPSSGLIMCAKNFAGHALLRWQLDTHELRREYVVAVHRPTYPCYRDVNLRLTTEKESSKSFVTPTGAPARTCFTGVAHVWPWLDPDSTLSFIVIKIHTGRHHQIRAHLTHLEHPPVADGKYNTHYVMLRDDHLYDDMVWFESFFGRPVVPLFSDCGPGKSDPRGTVWDRRGAQ
eukprot:gnl/TRDRNA2_/TRDRNA2_174825_c0_seq1.p1 gnl/TRDRNA2_/TRDRNA2_174825_c0~~gnl/TRDRNA2_/TRDRNA2_174825_c0_seq1.p1  ORF type:complete len:309 (+),score=37.28 gnl/TRDRNA2_/TRDRNA2_174825_c0_seq1:92-1018(+)